jgi:choline dehydrogenase-like flavoprotein
VQKRAGALVFFTWDVTTFSHAVGTVRMGDDERTAPLDPDCRFRGLENLWVTDGSVFPTSGGVNPSLTISANALRVGRAIAAALSASAVPAAAGGGR